MDDLQLSHVPMTRPGMLIRRPVADVFEAFANRGQPGHHHGILVHEEQSYHGGMDVCASPGGRLEVGPRPCLSWRGLSGRRRSSRRSVERCDKDSMQLRRRATTMTELFFPCPVSEN
jgi:hypothetical protein